MPYISLTATDPDAQWEVRAYLDENRQPACHLAAVARYSTTHAALIVTEAEAMDLLEACRRAIEAMRDLDSHPALTERD